MSNSQILAQIQQELDRLQPYIQSHGGQIELVSFQDGIVSVRLMGTCLECPMSFYTLTYGLEKQLKAQNPAILEVRTV